MIDNDNDQEQEESGFVVSERVYEQQGHRLVLVATAGDIITEERASELGLTGRSKNTGTAVQGVPEIGEPLLSEGQRPIDSPEADARATGDTAEAMARGGTQPAPSPSVTHAGTRSQDRPKAAPRKRKQPAKATRDKQQ
jgi:hypothetical protein